MRARWATRTNALPRGRTHRPTLTPPEELFREGIVSADEIRDAAPGSADRVRELEHELRLTRENLVVTIEELGTINEALRAANEEQESINRALGVSQQALRAATAS